MKKHFFILIVWIVFILILFGNIFYLPELFLINITTIAGWFLFAVQITINHSERMYLFIKRILFNIKNESCVWNIQAELNGNFDRTLFEKLDIEFSDIGNDSYRIIKISNVRRIYKLHTISIEIVLDTPEILHLYVHDMRVSFRDSKDIIDKNLANIFEKVQYVAKADSGEFGMHVLFGEYNPYFSFFIKRLNAKDIHQYNIKFSVEQDRIAVSNNGIEITADSFNKLNQLSKSYLALTNPR